MLLDILSFGKFREIEPNIIEITIFEGVELDRQRIGLVVAALTERFGEERYAILSNRVNRYCHTHESMQALAELANLSGFAILIYSSISHVAAGIHELYQDNARVFCSRGAALEWLRQGLIEGDKSVRQSVYGEVAAAH